MKKRENKKAPTVAGTTVEALNRDKHDPSGIGHNRVSESLTDTHRPVKPKRTSKPVVRIFTFSLSDEEIVKKAESAGKRKRAHLELAAEFDRVKADYKGRLEKLEREIADDLRCVEQRAESREVMADEVHDFELAQVFWFFEGQIKERREMYPHERQLHLEIEHEDETA